MKRKRVKRDKAFLGAIVGAVAGLAGSAIGGAISGNKAKAQLRAQQRAQNKQDTLAMAQNLSASYGEQEYVDEFNKRVTFKNGGKMKKRKCSAGTKVSMEKRYACGGRHKTACGGRKKAEWGASDTSALISGIGGGLNSIVSSAVTGNTGTVKQGDMYAGTPKEHLEQPDYIANPNNNINPNEAMFRCGGGRKRKACGGSKRKACGGTKKS